MLKSIFFFLFQKPVWQTVGRCLNLLQVLLGVELLRMPYQGPTCDKCSKKLSLST